MTPPRWKQALWRTLGSLVFRWSPHTLHQVRRRILAFFGADLRGRVKIRRSARIECPWNLTARDLAIVGDHAQLLGPAPIHLGARSVVSQHTTLATRYLDPDHPEHPRIDAPITIADDAWVATDALVLAGATVSEGCVVGARAYVPARTTTEPWSVSVGQPVRALKQRVLNSPSETTP